MPIFTSKMSLKCHKKPISVLKKCILVVSMRKQAFLPWKINFFLKIYEKYAIFAYFHEK